MGARGPAPAPKAILKARGSWRGNVAGNASLPIEIPSCPAFLSKEAKAEWKRQVKQLERLGVIAKIDRALLAAYCEAWAEFVEVKKEIADAFARGEPWVFVINAGLLNARNRAVDRMVKIAAQFGFSPSARARLNAPAQGQEEPDGKGRFFSTVG